MQVDQRYKALGLEIENFSSTKMCLSFLLPFNIRPVIRLKPDEYTWRGNLDKKRFGDI